MQKLHLCLKQKSNRLSLLKQSSSLFLCTWTRAAFGRSQGGRQHTNTSTAYYSHSSFWTLTRRTQQANTSAAFFISSRFGNVGAIRIIESFGSMPYGNGAPAAVKVMPASFAFATIAFAHPSSASKQIK